MERVRLKYVKCKKKSSSPEKIIGVPRFVKVSTISWKITLQLVKRTTSDYYNNALEQLLLKIAELVHDLGLFANYVSKQLHENVEIAFG